MVVGWAICNRNCATMALSCEQCLQGGLYMGTILKWLVTKVRLYVE
jgi:hypothetical protein